MDAVTIAALRDAEIGAATARLKQLECPVCMQQREDLTNPPCQHTCCLPCLTRAHATNRKCPICRAEIRSAVMSSLQVHCGLRDEVRHLTCVVQPKLLLVSNLTAALASGAPMPTLVAAAKAVRVAMWAPSFPRSEGMEQALTTAFRAASLPAQIAARSAYRRITHSSGNWLEHALAVLDRACKTKNEALLVSCIDAMRADAEWDRYASGGRWSRVHIYESLGTSGVRLQDAIGWVTTEDGLSAIESVLDLLQNLVTHSFAAMMTKARLRIFVPPTATAITPGPVPGVKRSARQAGLPPVGSS